MKETWEYQASKPSSASSLHLEQNPFDVTNVTCDIGTKNDGLNIYQQYAYHLSVNQNMRYS